MEAFWARVFTGRIDKPRSWVVWAAVVVKLLFIRATLASAGFSCRRVSFRPSFRLSQVGVLLKRLNVGSR